jgi:hypothetical protein
VGSIPFGLSALIDEQPDSIVVWLLASDWPEHRAWRLKKALGTGSVSREQVAGVVHQDLHAV